MVNEDGTIIVSWPHESDPNWTQDVWIQLKSAIPILKQYGLTYKATNSSTFLLWEGNRQSAEALAEVLEHAHPLLSVEFELEWPLKY